MKVTKERWHEVADNLAQRRKENPITPNLDLYRLIVETVHVGHNVLDVGAGQCYLNLVIPDGHTYNAIDPFPIQDDVLPLKAEDMNGTDTFFDTVFMLAALDNVQDVFEALKGLKYCARENVVILTGIDIEPDQYHTHKITRETLIGVLGEPLQEIEVSPKVFLFEWKL